MALDKQSYSTDAFSQDAFDGLAVGEYGAAWGISWGDSWGSSWGPLHEVEEEPGRYYGNGKLKPYREQDPFADATDAELEQLVRDKWDLIERSRAPSIPASSSEYSAPAPSIAQPAVDQNPIKNAKPGAAVDQPGVALDLPGDDQEKRAEAARRQAQEDEALLLLLAELL